MKKFYIFALSVIILIALGAALIRLDSYLQNGRNTQAQTTTEKTSAVVDSASEIFRTEYFQFQANKSWSEVPNQTTGERFVYHSYNGSLIEKIITVYVKNIPSNLQATRILPVEIKDNNLLKPAASVSEHCNKVTGGPVVGEKVVSFEEVKFKCDVDNTNYVVLTGMVQGTSTLALERPDKSTVLYAIEFRDVTAYPDGDEFMEMMASFQTR